MPPEFTKCKQYDGCQGTVWQMGILLVDMLSPDVRAFKRPEDALFLPPRVPQHLSPGMLPEYWFWSSFPNCFQEGGGDGGVRRITPVWYKIVEIIFDLFFHKWVTCRWPMGSNHSTFWWAEICYFRFHLRHTHRKNLKTYAFLSFSSVSENGLQCNELNPGHPSIDLQNTGHFRNKGVWFW